VSPAPAAPTPAPIGALGVPETVDGKRRIQLLTGTPDDPLGAPTLHGLSNRKNALVLELISAERVTALRTHGAEVVVSDLAELLDRP
jgi:hypothetical protein